MTRCMSDDVMKDEYPDSAQRLAICSGQWENKEMEFMGKEKKNSFMEGGEAMKHNNYEPRAFMCQELRVIQPEGKDPVITGYAATFDTESEDLGGFREKIMPGAFRPSFRKSDTVALYDHDRKYILGRKSARTLSVQEDDEGLKVTIKPPKWASWVMESIDRGDLRAMSFGFIVKRDQWEETSKGPLRTLVEIDRLLDVSIVTHPAYPNTSVALRSLDAWKHENIDEIVDEKDENKGQGEIKPKTSRAELLLRQLELKAKLQGD